MSKMMIAAVLKNSTVRIERWERSGSGYNVRLHLSHARGKRKDETVALCWRQGGFTFWPKKWDSALRPVVSDLLEESITDLGDRYGG